MNLNAFQNLFSGKATQSETRVETISGPSAVKLYADEFGRDASGAADLVYLLQLSQALDEQRVIEVAAARARPVRPDPLAVRGGDEDV